MIDTNYIQIARDFWYQATIGQSLLIKGQAAGEIVLRTLEECDKEENMIDDGKGLRRKRQKPSKSIGGYISQRCFRWSSDVRDGIKHYTIWRIQ
jgi:hypothetical protein